MLSENFMIILAKHLPLQQQLDSNYHFLEQDRTLRCKKERTVKALISEKGGSFFNSQTFLGSNSQKIFVPLQ